MRTYTLMRTYSVILGVSLFTSSQILAAGLVNGTLSGGGSGGAGGSATNVNLGTDGSITITTNSFGSWTVGTSLSKIPGTLSLAQLPSPTVTNRTFLSPMMFGAAAWGQSGDATHNDSTAFTACFAAATNFGSVVDLEGKSYFLTNGVTNQIGNMVVQNGTIWVPNNFPGAVFTGTLPGSPQGNGSVWTHLQFFAAGTNANPSSVAIQTKPYGTGYGNDATISYCLCSNFWRFATIVNTPQFDVEHNTACTIWSNAVYVATPSGNGGSGGYEGGDESLIAFNDFNVGDGLVGPQIQYITNHMNTIQLDGYAIHLTIMDNNLGHCRQIVHASPPGGSEITFIGGENEGFLGTGGMFPLFEFWNTTIKWYGGGNPTMFGVTPNYLACFGIYATNSHLNFSKDYFGPINIGQWATNFDIGSFGPSGDGPWSPYDHQMWPRFFNSNGGVCVLHTNYGDAGYVLSLPNGCNPYDTTPDDPSSLLWYPPNGLQIQTPLTVASSFLNTGSGFKTSAAFQNTTLSGYSEVAIGSTPMGGPYDALYLDCYGPQWTSSGSTLADSSTIWGNGTNGLTLITSSGAPIRTYVNGAFGPYIDGTGLHGNGAGLTNLQGNTFVREDIMLWAPSQTAHSPAALAYPFAFVTPSQNNNYFQVLRVADFAAAALQNTAFTNIYITGNLWATNTFSGGPGSFTFEAVTNGPAGVGTYAQAGTLLSPLNYVASNILTACWSLHIPLAIVTNTVAAGFYLQANNVITTNIWLLSMSVTNAAQ